MTIDKFQKMIEILENQNLAPTRLAKELGADKRTVDKLIDTGTKLKILECKSIELSGRKFMSCTLSKEFKNLSKRGSDDG